MLQAEGNEREEGISVGMKVQDIYDLMDRFEAGSATRLKVVCDGFELELERDGEHPVPPAPPAPPAPVVVQLPGAPGPAAPAGAPAPAPAPAPAAAEAPAAPAPVAAEDDCIVAPLVGVFYAAPAPDQDPYVQPGDHVAKGETACLLEAMKMMSEVPAPCDCTIEEILVADGELLEYGAPIIRYRAD